MAVVRARRQVGAAALPGARLTAAETPESRGAGLEQARAEKDQAIAGVFARGAQIGTSVLREMVDRERENANETAMLKASNALSDWKTKALYDPENGALTKKGEAAMPLPEQLRADFDKTADAIRLGLGNDDQRRAFDRLRSQSYAQVDLEVRRHVFTEMQEFRASELKSAIDNGVNEAIRSANDPQLVGLSLAKVEQQMRTNLPKLGVGKDALAEQIAAVRSNVHVGVINQLLAQEDDVRASAYFKEMKGEIAGDKIDDVTRALEEGSIRGVAQKTADEILAAGGTLKEQLEKAKGLDPKVRDQVEQRLEHRATLTEREEREQKEEVSRRAFDIVDKTGTVSKIPPAQWAMLDGGVRAALRSYAKGLAEGVPVKTDPAAMYDLLTMSSANPTAFLQTNLLAYKDKLGKEDLEQMMRLQASMRTGDDKGADKLFVSEKNQNAMVDEALTSIGLVASEADLRKPENKDLADRITRFRRAVREAVARVEADPNHKGPAKDDEVQRVIDTLIAPTGSRKTGYFSTQPTYVFETAQARVTSAKDIPQTVRRQIDAALASRQLPVNDANRLTLFNEYVAIVRKDR